MNTGNPCWRSPKMWKSSPADAAALVARARHLYALAWLGKTAALRQDATAALDATMRALREADEAAWRRTCAELIARAGEYGEAERA